MNKHTNYVSINANSNVTDHQVFTQPIHMGFVEFQSKKQCILKRNFDILSCYVFVYARFIDNYSEGYSTIGLIVTESD